MKLARMLALLAAALVAAAIVFNFSRPRDEGTSPARTGSGAGPVAQGTASPPSFDPEPGSGTDLAGRNGATGVPAVSPADAPTQMPKSLPETGTPVPADAEVSVVVPWGHGEPRAFRYEIEDLVIAKDRATDQVNAGRTFYFVTLTVAAGDGTGAARLRLVIDSIRMQGFGPNGIPFDVNSRVPDDPQLNDVAMARRVRPTWALIGCPLEFRLDAEGTVTDVDGADDWRERYLTEVQQIEKGAVNDVEDAPRREVLIDVWSEYLFPKIGGGKLAGGASRPWRRAQKAGGGWTVIWDGKVEATRDDPDAFRVDISAGPHTELTGGVPTSDDQARIAGVRAIGDAKSYRGAYRFGRSPGALIEAQIDAKYEFWGSRKAGSAMPGQQQQYDRKFLQLLRRAIIRRTDG